MSRDEVEKSLRTALEAQAMASQAVSQANEAIKKARKALGE